MSDRKSPWPIVALIIHSQSNPHVFKQYPAKFDEGGKPSCDFSVPPVMMMENDMQAFIDGKKRSCKVVIPPGKKEGAK